MCDAIARIYSVHSLGGPLHIVLEDGNLEDESIQFCLETCETHHSTLALSIAERRAFLDDVQLVANSLLNLAIDLRCDLYDLHWKVDALGG